MKFRFVTVELFTQRQRVRRAERVLRHDKAATARAFDRFLRDVVASPAGLAACATLGFCFDRARGGGGSGSEGFLRRAGSLVTIALWARRMFATIGSATARAG